MKFTLHVSQQDNTCHILPNPYIGNGLDYQIGHKYSEGEEGHGGNSLVDGWQLLGHAVHHLTHRRHPIPVV